MCISFTIFTFKLCLMNERPICWIPGDAVLITKILNFIFWNWNQVGWFLPIWWLEVSVTLWICWWVCCCVCGWIRRGRVSTEDIFSSNCSQFNYLKIGLKTLYLNPLIIAKNLFQLVMLWSILKIKTNIYLSCWRKTEG